MISSVCRSRSFISVAAFLLLAGALSAQESQVVLTRGGSTIVLEPYAPNILRVTLSLKREPALAAPGYGVIGRARRSRMERQPDQAGRRLQVGSHRGHRGPTPGSRLGRQRWQVFHRLDSGRAHHLHHARRQEAAGDDRLDAGRSQSEGRNGRDCSATAARRTPSSTPWAPPLSRPRTSTITGWARTRKAFSTIAATRFAAGRIIWLLQRPASACRFW